MLRIIFKRIGAQISFALSLLLALYFISPAVLSYAAEETGASTAIQSEDGRLVINKSAFLNTASVIRAARAKAEAGMIFDAMTLYQYASEVCKPEKEAILRRKIIKEKDDLQGRIETELERRKTQKINELYEQGRVAFKENKLDEAGTAFKEILTINPEHAEALNYVNTLIPQRVKELDDQHQSDLEAGQREEIRELYIKAYRHFDKGELEEAKAIYTQILEIDLDEEKAQAYLDGRIPKAYETKPQDDVKRAAKRAELTVRDEKYRSKEFKAAQKTAWKKFVKRQRRLEKHPPEPVDYSGEPTVLVNEIKFSGNTVFDEAALKQIVQSRMGKEMSLPELKLLADDVKVYYHDGGYFLTQVIVPEQDFKSQNGVVNFTVIEGRLGEILLSGNKRYKENRILKVFAKVRQGDPLNKKNLVRALLVLNSYPSLVTSSLFQAGAEPGTTDINISVKESRRVKGGLEFNNLGLDTSGKYRMSPELSFPNLTGRGDLLETKWVQAIDQSGVYYGQASYKTPVGYNGFQLKSYGSFGSFALGKEFAALDIESDTLSWGVGASYPYLLTQSTSMGTEAWFEFKNFDQSVFGGATKTIEDRVRKLRVELLNLDRQDTHGRTLASFGIHQGLGNILGGMENDSRLSSRSFAKADNMFSKITPGLARVQSLTKRLTLVGRVSGQYGFTPLVAGEQWSIGGMDSVHGHQASTFLGDDGFTTNLESRFTLWESTHQKYQFLLFGDHGSTRIKRPTFTQNPWEHISGTGVGLYGNLYDMFDARVDWGFPIGKKTDDSSILYFQIKYSF